MKKYISGGDGRDLQTKCGFIYFLRAFQLQASHWCLMAETNYWKVCVCGGR